MRNYTFSLHYIFVLFLALYYNTVYCSSAPTSSSPSPSTISSTASSLSALSSIPSLLSNKTLGINVDIPYDLNIIVIGFSGDSSYSLFLDIEKLLFSCQSSVPHGIFVSSPQADTMDISFKPQFHIQYAPNNYITQLESLMAKELKYHDLNEWGESPYVDPESSSPPPIFSLSHIPIQSLMESFYKQLSSQSKYPHSPYLFLVNPSKERVFSSYLSSSSSSAMAYRYFYLSEDLTPMQLFVGEKPFVYVDLGAEPPNYGPLDGKKGGVFYPSLPLLQTKSMMREDDHDLLSMNHEEEEDNNASSSFIAHLSSFILLSLRHVFIPDFRFRSLPYAEKLIVPLFVFRNHQRFDPFHLPSFSRPLAGEQGPTAEFSINRAVLREKISSLLLPSQSLLFVPQLHSLYDFPSLSIALSTSIKQRTHHTTDTKGAIKPFTINYIDSNLLFSHLWDSSNKQLRDLLLSHSSAPSFSQFPLGYRLLPIIVLSLLSYPKELLFENGENVVSRRECVLVLQSGDDHVPSSYFIGNHNINKNNRIVERHILNGFIGSIGGILPEHTRYNQRKDEFIYNYLFSGGCTLSNPFASFSSSLCISQLHIQSIRRNNWLSRLNKAMRITRETLNKLNVFYERWGKDMRYSTGEQGQHNVSVPFLASFFFPSSSLHISSDFNPIPLETLNTLILEAIGIREMMGTFKRDIVHYSSSPLNVEKEEGMDRLSSKILNKARTFRLYVQNELIQSQHRLECCAVTLTTATTTTTTTTITATSSNSPSTTSLSSSIGMVMQEIFKWIFILCIGYICYSIVLSRIKGKGREGIKYSKL